MERNVGIAVEIPDDGPPKITLGFCGGKNVRTDAAKAVAVILKFVRLLFDVATSGISSVPVRVPGNAVICDMTRGPGIYLFIFSRWNVD
jgi:hypothetical protein